MNLADITTKCYILALIIRDDGERLLLGDGAYEFKDSQQHFIANTYANDVVELQGTDGQMLAGQVRRTATQTFSGYIGDATFSKQAVESARRDFLMFFRKKHYYTAVYVFSDGTAIQRDRGYIVNAPSVPELYQRYPEWSVGLNFEDPNYYEYAEDDLGQEIAAHKVELELSTAMSGGLIWDGDGAVSDDLSYVGTEIQGEGKNFQLADTGTATLKSAELLGDAEQDGTPTPDAPQEVNTVTGEQTVKIEGKNLLDSENAEFANGYISSSDGSFTSGGGSTASKNMFYLSVGTYTFSNTENRNLQRVCYFSKNKVFVEALTITSGKTFTMPSSGYVRIQINGSTTLQSPQLELGSTATTYEPYQGQEFKVNLGKNLFDPFAISTSGIVVATDGTLTISGNASANGYKHTGKTLAELAPTLKVGDTVYLYLESDWSGTKAVYTSHGGYWSTGTAKTITSDMLTDGVIVYGGYQTTTTIRVMITRSLATAYATYFTPIELAKIGNYQDRIYKDEGKWYIYKEIGHIQKDTVIQGLGDGTIGINEPSFTGAFCIQSGSWNSAGGDYDNDITLARLSTNCGQYVAQTISGNTGANSMQDGTFCQRSGTNDRIYFRFSSLTGKTGAEVKTILQAQGGADFYYALATPTTTEITNSELVGQLERLQHSRTYADITNFSITATSPNLPAFLKVVAFGDDAIPQGGYVWEDGGTGGATTITVDGVDNAQPIWTVVGPATNPSLTNITTGESIQWTGVVPNGQTLVVNMADMTASLSGANVFEFISGSWITLQAGNNRVSYSATAATGIATLEWNGVVG